MFFSDKHFRKLQRKVLFEHFDANDAIFLERELVVLRATTYTVEYPELVARTFAPKATDIPASADTYAYKVFTPVGRAQWLAYKTGDIPRIDISAREVQGSVRPIGLAYGWNIAELREAARLGTNLPSTKAELTRDGIEMFIDDVLAYGTSAGLDTSGAPVVGLNGLSNNPNVEVLADALAWDDKTSGPDAAAILADLNRICSAVTLGSDGVYKADTLLLPTAKYEAIKTTPYSELNGDSILKVFKGNNPDITTIAPWNKLNGAGLGSDGLGGGGKPRAIVYSKQKKVLESVIPQEFESLPPEARGFEFIINCHARCGGVKVYLPPAMKYVDFAAVT